MKKNMKRIHGIDGFCLQNEGFSLFPQTNLYYIIFLQNPYVKLIRSGDLMNM